MASKLSRTDERPVIGITSWRRAIATGLGSSWPAHTLGVEYADAVIAAGGAPVILPPSPRPEVLLERLDGLVLSGGEDLALDIELGDPGAGAWTRDPARDAFEHVLLEGAQRRRMPVLAICRGMQLANVHFGGTLIADLPATGEHPAADRASSLSRRHEIELEEASLLRDLWDVDRRIVNSIHHQAVDRVADGFRVVARAADGVIEAIEPRATDTAVASWPFWAVQWHPEKTGLPSGADDVEDVRRDERLFVAFVDACRPAAAARTFPLSPQHPIPTT